MKHKSCLYFDEVVNYLMNTHASLRLEDLAIDLDMTTETLRRKRKGISIPDCKEVEVLYRKYQINPLYFFGNKNILIHHNTTSGFVTEPTEEYKNTKNKEIEHLEQRLKDKEELIDMLKSNLETGKKRIA